MIDWNELDDPPKDVNELWNRLNLLVRSLPEIVVLKKKRIVAGAAGTLIAHGQLRTPRAGWANVTGGSPSTNYPVITELNVDTVKVVVGGGNIDADIFLVM